MVDEMNEDLIGAEESPSQSDADNSSVLSLPAARDEGQEKPAHTSQLATLFIIVNVTIGAGLLAMPFATNAAGLVSSIMVQLIFLCLIVITCIMCIELTFKSDSLSYHEIVQKHCHPSLYYLTQVSIFLITFGTAVAFIVTIGDQSDRVFASLYDSTFCSAWYLDRRFIMTMVTLFLIEPLCSARTVDFLKYASFLGIIAIGFIFAVVVKNFVQLDKSPPGINFYPTSWTDISGILPVYCLSYQCHLSLVPTVATTQRRNKNKTFITITAAMVTVFLVYSTISVLAVLTFGATIKKDLTESFPGKGWITLATVGIVGVKCALTLPAAYLPARLSLVDILSSKYERFAALSEPVKRIGVTMVFLDASLVLAIYMPDILAVVNLLGVLAVMLIFTIPALAYIDLVNQNRSAKQQAMGVDFDAPPKYTARDLLKLYTCYFVVAFGTTMTAVVLYKSVHDMIHSTPSESLCKA